MKHSLRLLSSAALFGASLVLGHAQPAFKILVVDMAKVYDTHWETQEQNAKLAHDQQAANEQLAQETKEGQALMDQYKELSEQATSPTLTNEARTKAQADAQKKAQEVQSKHDEVVAFQSNTERMLQQRIKNFRDLMLEKITTIATKIAKDKGATLLLDKSGPTLIGISNVIYSDPAYDITDEVLKEANKDRPAPSATPAAAPTATPAPAAAPTTGASPMITVPNAKK